MTNINFKEFLIQYYYIVSQMLSCCNCELSQPIVNFIDELRVLEDWEILEITAIYQPTNAHTISHKTHSKHFKTLRRVSENSSISMCTV